MDINERLEELRADHATVKQEADNYISKARQLDHEADVIMARIQSFEEAVGMLPASIETSSANGEAKPPRRPRRDIKGMVQAALDAGAIRDIASLAIQLECRPSQVADALKHISQT